MISKSGDLLSVEEQGSTAGHEYPMPTQQQLLDGYRQLVIGRRVNDQNYALVRQGRMAVYPSSHGQEASEVAAALCLSPTRSEEHTSELQSRGHLVCRRLLEDKKGPRGCPYERAQSRWIPIRSASSTRPGAISDAAARGAG